MSVAWGLLSTARVNRHVIGAARASDRFHVAAVASRSPDRAREYAREHDIPRAHGDYDALLADPEVDAVYISLPNGMHVDWTMRALEAGKHVLCEKPFSAEPEGVARAFDLAGRRGLVLSEGFMWRHHPQTAAIERLLADEAVGRVRLVRASFSFKLASAHGASDARFDPTLDGGAVMDVGCYCLSAMRLAAGEPVRISAMRSDGPSGVDVTTSGVIEFADGVLGHFDCGFVMPFRHEFEIVGEAGTIFVADPWHVAAPGVEVRREGPARDRLVEHVEVGAANAFRLQFENVSGAIRGTDTLRLGRDDALGQALAIAATYRSAATGACVEVGRA